jgi:PAS domain S-box-containing protein
MLIDPESLPFRELVDAAPDGIMVTGQHGTILLANAEAARMFRYARDELIGKPIHVLVPERLQARHPEHVQRFHDSPRLRPMGSGLDLSGRRSDGSEFPIEISLSPIQHEGQRLVVAGIRDITERRQIEREAKRATAYLMSAVDAIPDAFALYDEEDRVVLVNSSCRQLLGGSFSGAIVGCRFEEVLAEALAAGVFDGSDESRQVLTERWLAYHREPRGTLEVRTRDGRHLRVTDRKTPEHGTVSLLMDVTADVLREAELRSASAAKSEFLASMSHELRTPLNAVLGFAQLLARDRKQPLTERQKERVQQVLHGGEQLTRLIDDVLDLSRIEAGQMRIFCEPVAVRDVLLEVLTTLEPMATRAQIRLVAADLPSGLPRVHADRARLAQILMNFGSNAIKYGRPDGRAIFEATFDSSRVRITVIDDGIGISADQHGKLFEPFQRAGQEAGPIEGTGIGLVISKRLAKLMEGSVGFTSEAGHGSRFWVEVPAHGDGSAQAGGDQRLLFSTARLPVVGAMHRVVYIEDNPSSIAFMRDLVEDLEGVELMTAPTAEIGLPLIRSYQPAVVIMDINLPGMSGLHAVRELQQWPETRDIPVIGLSAAALLNDRSRAEHAGFTRYLTKPLQVGELTAVLEQLLARRER